MNEEIAKLRFGEWDETRCRVCGWKIVPEGESGCWKSNCSMRPMPNIRADAPADIEGNNCEALKAAGQIAEEKRWSVEIGIYPSGVKRCGIFTINMDESQDEDLELGVGIDKSLSSAIAQAMYAALKSEAGK